MKRLLMACGLLGTFVLVSMGSARRDEKKTAPLQVVVLIPADIKALAPGAKIKHIDSPQKTAGKQALKEVKYKNGEAVKRLHGTYVVKEVKIALDDGNAVACRVLVAVEPGRTILRNVKYVAPMEAQTEQGVAAWYGYTAQFDTPAPEDGGPPIPPPSK
jgi:hypothetical protein